MTSAIRSLFAIKDFRLALRQLIKSPGFTLLAVVTLGLGIGVNTSMFSILNGMLLKPLPYANSAQLDRIDRVTAQKPEGGFSAADFFDLQREMHGYGEVAAYEYGGATLSEPGQPAEIGSAIRVSANFFSMLGIQPQIGRDFRAREELHGNDRVVIISRRCWQNRFGGRADIIGHIIRVDGEPHEIVGVLPATFDDWRHLGGTDYFRPLGVDKEKSADRRSIVYYVIGRRSGQLSRAQAEGFIANFGARLAADFPEVNAGSTWRTVPLNDTVMDQKSSSILSMLIGLSAFVLLIACSNLANLLLARTMARAREFAVRSALGASRTQLLRPLVAESLILALAGGVCAMIVAHWAMHWLAVRSTFPNGEQVVFVLDWTVLGWAFVASLATALAFGLAPALFALRLNVNNTLKSGARSMTGGRGHQRFRHVLIVGQFALAMILLSAAGLFVRGLDDLIHHHSGWESDHLLTGTFMLPAAGYPDPDKITAFNLLTVERLESLPGVASVGISYFTPFFKWYQSRKYLVEGRARPEPGHEPVALVNGVSPHYFETVRTSLLAGRAFNDRDTLASPKVFIINEAMARGLFGDEIPIGRHLARAGDKTLQWGEIVGVVGDVKSMLPNPDPVGYQLYQPMAQEPRLYNQIAVRTAGVAPSTLVEGIRTVMKQIDPDLPVYIQSADTLIFQASTSYQIIQDMLSSFALLGLGLATLGIYGVSARATAQRTNEFAIRLALGASARDITRMVLGSGMKLALIGSTIGLLGALGVSRLLEAAYSSMHFDSAPVIFVTTAFLIMIALIACYLPARSACRISPAEALRSE